MSTTPPRRVWIALALAMLTLCAGPAARAEAVDAVHALDAAKARARISAQRADAKSTLANQERACRQEFVVAPCVEAVRREQRAVLTRLRNEELALDDAQRQESAAGRRQELLDKAAARDAKAKADAAELKAAHPAHAASQATDGSAPDRAGTNAVGRSRGASKTPSKADRAAQEDSNRAQFEARARSAQAHREAVEQRNAERASKGKKAHPLPAPTAASSPAGPASAR